jgi:hypothetical protein
MQTSLFDPAPCGNCGVTHAPHFLPNYDPPVWVIGRPPKCGENLYAKTREQVVIDWNSSASLSLAGPAGRGEG